MRLTVSIVNSLICLTRQVGTQGPSDGHSGTKGWASTAKRWAFIAHAVCTECPKVGRFLGTPCRSAAFMHNAS